MCFKIAAIEEKIILTLFFAKVDLEEKMFSVSTQK
jgi:hypothetical protein